MCSLAASGFRVEGGETHEESCDRQPYGNAAITTAGPEQPSDAIRSLLCIYCRTDKFVY